MISTYHLRFIRKTFEKIGLSKDNFITFRVICITRKLRRNLQCLRKMVTKIETIPWWESIGPMGYLFMKKTGVQKSHATVPLTT